MVLEHAFSKSFILLKILGLLVLSGYKYVCLAGTVLFKLEHLYVGLVHTSLPQILPLPIALCFTHNSLPCPRRHFSLQALLEV